MKRAVSAPKTGMFRIRVNPDMRKQLEAIYAQNGLTLTDAVNVFFQQSFNWTPFYCSSCRSHRLAVPPFGTTSRTRPQIWSAVTSCRSGALL